MKSYRKFPRFLATALNLFQGWLLATFALSSYAQLVGPAHCYITGVEKTQLSNAVCITIQADGLLDVRANPDDFFNVAAFTTGKGDWRKPIERIPFRITNARTKVGNFVDVSMYPVSHVEIAISPEAKEGVGLDVNVVLYVPAVTWFIHLTSMDWEMEGAEIEGPSISVQLSQDMRSLIVMVTSDRYVELKPEIKPKEAIEKKKELFVEYQDNQLDLTALNVDIHHLFKAISEKTGAKIFVDDVVKRTASLSLSNISPEEAIQSISRAYGLSFAKSSDAYIISESLPIELSPYGLSKTEVFPLKYLPAKTARSLLPNFLLRYIRYSPDQSALIATAPEAMLDKIRSDLSKLDLPPPKISVEALAVEMTSTVDLEASLNLKYSKTDVQASFNLETGEVSYKGVTNLPEDFEARLNALVALKKGKIRAKPRITVMNGQKGELFLGIQRYVLVLPASRWELGRVQEVNIGVRLEATPWTGGGGEITVKIVPEVSNIAELDPVTHAPLVSLKRAETTIRVKDGETIVLGGLIQKQAYKTWKKVPIVGDLPIFGWLFRSKSISQGSSELLIFVTVKILPMADESL